MKRKNILSEKLELVRMHYVEGLMNAINRCVNNMQSKDLNYSWLKGFNGVVAIALATDPFLFKNQLLQYYFYERENINHTSFSLSGGNMGSIKLLNTIESVFGIESHDWLDNYKFNDLFNLNNDHLVRSMLPKGVYNGIGGVLELDITGSDNLLVPDAHWMKNKIL